LAGSCQNNSLQREEWETEFCLPFYRGGYRDTNTSYWTAHSVIAGAGEDLMGIYVVTPRARWAGMNLAFLSEPVFDLQSLRHRIERATVFYRDLRLGWTLVVCEDWIAPDLREAAGHLCRELSFSLPLEAFSMSGRIGPQPAPAGLEIRRVSTPEMRREFADINAEAWNVRVELTREILENDAVWRGPTEGYMGYVGGEAVSVVMVYPVEGKNYLAWGATRTAQRRKGYGEAVLRHAALQNVGGPDSMLISSPMALKVWGQAGLEIVSKFSLYVSGDRKD
jgi:hypothetical protein